MPSQRSLADEVHAPVPDHQQHRRARGIDAVGAAEVVHERVAVVEARLVPVADDVQARGASAN